MEPDEEKDPTSNTRTRAVARLTRTRITHKERHSRNFPLNPSSPPRFHTSPVATASTNPSRPPCLLSRPMLTFHLRVQWHSSPVSEVRDSTDMLHASISLSDSSTLTLTPWRRFSSRSPLSARRTLESLVTLGYSYLARAPE